MERSAGENPLSDSNTPFPIKRIYSVFRIVFLYKHRPRQSLLAFNN